MFNENPETTPRTLVEVIKEVLNIEYSGQLRSNVLGDNHPASQRGQQGSTGNVASGKQNQDGQVVVTRDGEAFFSCLGNKISTPWKKKYQGWK